MTIPSGYNVVYLPCGKATHLCRLPGPVSTLCGREIRLKPWPSVREVEAKELCSRCYQRMERRRRGER